MPHDWLHRSEDPTDKDEICRVCGFMYAGRGRRPLRCQPNLFATELVVRFIDNLDHPRLKDDL